MKTQNSNHNKKKTNNEDEKYEEEEEQGEEIVAFVPKYGIEARVKVSKEFNARQNMFWKLKVKIEIEQMPFGRSKLKVLMVE